MEEIYIKWKAGEGKKFFYSVLSKLDLKPIELAKKLNLHRSTVWFWILERNNSPLNVIKQLCNLANIDFNSLQNCIERFSKPNRFERGNTIGFKRNDERSKILARKGFQKLREFLSKNPEIRKQSAMKGLAKMILEKHFGKDIETVDGTKVRSEEEKTIYEKYLSLGLKPIYEKDFIKLRDTVVIPDFFIIEKMLYHEHMGVINNIDYFRKKVMKIKELSKKFQNFNFLITTNKKNLSLLIKELQEIHNLKVMEYKQFLECTGVELTSKPKRKQHARSASEGRGVKAPGITGIRFEACRSNPGQGEVLRKGDGSPLPIMRPILSGDLGLGVKSELERK